MQPATSRLMMCSGPGAAVSCLAPIVSVTASATIATRQPGKPPLEPALEHGDNIARLHEGLPAGFALNGPALAGTNHRSIVLDRAVGEAAGHSHRCHHRHAWLVWILAWLVHFAEHVD